MEGLVSAGLVGRERELERARWTLLGEGSDATALVLEGPAGIGKTSVWRAAVAEARGRGIRVLQARASEGEHELDFVGLADLLEPVWPEVVSAQNFFAYSASASQRLGVALDRASGSSSATIGSRDDDPAEGTEEQHRRGAPSC